MSRCLKRGFGRSLAGTAGMDVCLLRELSVVGEDVSATGRSLVQRSPTECGVSECDLEISTMRRSRLTGGCRTMKKTCKDTASFAEVPQ